MSAIEVKKPQDAPRELHWAIFRGDSIHVPGDERSRSAPGHGFPEHTEHIIKYTAYTDVEEWTKAVEEMEKRRHIAYYACAIHPATVELKYNIDIQFNKKK